MNWEVIAAISQLVAAIGLMLSFIFLGIQLRQNTKAIQSSAIQTLVQSLSSNAQTNVENEYLVPLMLRANAGTETCVRKNVHDYISGLSWHFGALKEFIFNGA